MRPSKNPFDIDNFTTRLVAAANFAGNVVHAQAGVANARSELILCSFTLTTDATVATRFPRISFDDPANAAELISSVHGTTASLAMNYIFAQGLIHATLSAEGYIYSPFPSDIYLLENWFQRITIINGVAGDLVSNLRFYYKIWPFEQ